MIKNAIGIGILGFSIYAGKKFCLKNELGIKDLFGKFSYFEQDRDVNVMFTALATMVGAGMYAAIKGSAVACVIGAVAVSASVYFDLFSSSVEMFSKQDESSTPKQDKPLPAAKSEKSHVEMVSEDPKAKVEVDYYGID